MLEVKFYDTVDDSLLKFAVIISQSNGKWVFCKHKERDTYEAPGGHREVGEDILETAKRELQEETGAIQFNIKPICVYSVTGKNSVNENGEETFGLLCFAEIREFSGQLDCEMEKVVLLDDLIATGGTMKAAAELVEELGGEVVKMLFLNELSDLNGREVLKDYDVESVVQFEGK